MTIGRRFVVDPTVSNTPPRSIAVTPYLSDYGETVTWELISNLQPNTTVKFAIIGTDAAAFNNTSLTGTVNVDSTGKAYITRFLDKFYQYNSNTNVSVQLNILSPGDTLLTISTSNVIIRQANTFTATGGNITTFTGGVDGLQGEYTLHSFTTAGNANLTVTNLGTYPDNTLIEVIAIGGGGAGGNGHWTNSPSGLSNAQIAAKVMGSYLAYSGAGGAGGNVQSTSHTAANYAIQNYPIRAGAGGTAALGGPGAGQSSFFASASGNIVAAGGSAGGGVIAVGNQRTSIGTGTGGSSGSVLGGAQGLRTFSSGSFSWTERSGGGGAGSANVGLAGGVTSGSIGSQTTSGGNGGNGGAGREIRITGNSFVAGGGGGGGTFNPVGPSTGGAGGGGAGGRLDVNETAGTNQLGGGGGGAQAAFYDLVAGSTRAAINYYTNTADGVSYTGANGGSGAVYIRYLSRYRQMTIE